MNPRWMWAAGGIVAAIGLALGVAVLLELIDPVVVSVTQLTTLTEHPVLGSVPWVG
jgi:capsular polysaccharide biosynthesis protein